MNEDTAIRLCIKHQDPAGFEFLVKKYRREAFFHASALMRNAEDAADACQESFTRAFVAFPKLTKLERFYPWFYRILRNCCLNMLSRKKTADKYYSEQTRADGTGKEFDNPYSILLQSEQKTQIWEVLDRLQPEFREILIMKYIQGLCYNEISDILAIPRGTVMSRLYHARKNFKHEYETMILSERE